jgi:hypothetical protein
MWQEMLGKRWLVVRQSSHREPHDFLCKGDLFGASPSGRIGRLDNGKETMLQFWSQPGRSCRLSSQEKCLRQGRRSSKKGSNLGHRFARVDASCGGENAALMPELMLWDRG